jgi:hypothetical protein
MVRFVQLRENLNVMSHQVDELSLFFGSWSSRTCDKKKLEVHICNLWRQSKGQGKVGEKMVARKKTRGPQCSLSPYAIAVHFTPWRGRSYFTCAGTNLKPGNIHRENRPALHLLPIRNTQRHGVRRDIGSAGPPSRKGEGVHRTPSERPKVRLRRSRCTGELLYGDPA